MPRANDIRETQTPPNAFVASAAPLRSDARVKPGDGSDTAWQEALWNYYDVIGELEYVANWIGNTISRAKLYPAFKGERTDEANAVEAVDELFGSIVGKRECLRQMGIQATIPGESYIFAWGGPENPQWGVFSAQAVKKTGSGYWSVDGINMGDTGPDFAMRSWQRHPRHPKQVMSPSKAALPILSEIYRLTQHIDAQLMSRLSSAGVLLIPNEMAFASASSKEGEEVTNDSKAQEFVKELSETMATAINNRGDASALVPIVVTADGDLLDKPRLLEFWSSLDQHAIELRQEAIRRLALSLDVPPEILTGTGDVSHWQAWAVDDASIKTHTEPLLMRITNDLTTGYLWPALEGVVPDEDLRFYTIEADTSDMRARPNRSKEAMELWDRGALSSEAMLRENGFDDTDKPEDKERQDWLRAKIATASLTPEMAAAAASALGVDLPAPEAESAGNELAPSPSLKDHPDRTANPSDEERRQLEKDAERKSRSAALLALSEHAVYRALERAGNRMANRFKFSQEGVEPPELYLYRQCSDAEASFMLEGCFGHLDRFAKRHDVSTEWLSSTLEVYTRGLILNRLPHTPERLAAALSKELVDA